MWTYWSQTSMERKSVNTVIFWRAAGAKNMVFDFQKCDFVNVWSAPVFILGFKPEGRPDFVPNSWNVSHPGEVPGGSLLHFARCPGVGGGRKLGLAPGQFQLLESAISVPRVHDIVCSTAHAEIPLCGNPFMRTLRIKKTLKVYELERDKNALAIWAPN